MYAIGGVCTIVAILIWVVIQMGMKGRMLSFIHEELEEGIVLLIPMAMFAGFFWPIFLICVFFFVLSRFLYLLANKGK